MKKFIHLAAIALLSLFSVSVSIQVWDQFSANSYEQLFLFCMAVGIELAKLALIPGAHKLWRAGDPLAQALTCMALFVTLISTATMVTYLDSKLVYYSDTVAKHERDIDIDAMKRTATKGLQEYDKHTKSLAVIAELETAVTPVVTGRNTLLDSLKQSAPKRYVTLCTIAVTVDLSIVALLLMMFNPVTPRNRFTEPEQQQAAPPKQHQVTPPKQSKPESEPQDKIYRLIHDFPEGEIIPVNQLCKEHGVSYRQFVKALAPFLQCNAVEKNADNRYLRTNRKMMQVVS